MFIVYATNTILLAIYRWNEKEVKYGKLKHDKVSSLLFKKCTLCIWNIHDKFLTRYSLKHTGNTIKQWGKLNIQRLYIVRLQFEQLLYIDDKSLTCYSHKHTGVVKDAEESRASNIRGRSVRFQCTMENENRSERRKEIKCML
jgi:hypothetical protein